VKILIGDFSPEVGRDDILKLKIGSESIHEISNGNGVRLVNFATSKHLTVKSMIFPHNFVRRFQPQSRQGRHFQTENWE
jgi:hypothetical protein